MKKIGKTLQKIFKDPISNLKVGDNIQIPFGKRFLWGVIIRLVEAVNEEKDKIIETKNKFLWKNFQQEYWKNNYNQEVKSDWIIEVKNMTEIMDEKGLYYPLDVIVDFKPNKIIRKEENRELWDCEKSSRSAEMGVFRYHAIRWWLYQLKRRILHKNYVNDFGDF